MDKSLLGNNFLPLQDEILCHAKLPTQNMNFLVMNYIYYINFLY